jgi:hypothetical protein
MQLPLNKSLFIIALEMAKKNNFLIEGTNVLEEKNNNNIVNYRFLKKMNFNFNPKKIMQGW